MPQSSSANPRKRPISPASPSTPSRAPAAAAAGPSNLSRRPAANPPLSRPPRASSPSSLPIAAPILEYTDLLIASSLTRAAGSLSRFGADSSIAWYRSTGSELSAALKIRRARLEAGPPGSISSKEARETQVVEVRNWCQNALMASLMRHERAEATVDRFHDVVRRHRLDVPAGPFFGRMGDEEDEDGVKVERATTAGDEEDADADPSPPKKRKA